jgi:hypothetical protein
MLSCTIFEEERMAITCPRCGLKNPSEAQRCDCGHVFTATPSEPRQCTNCGREFGTLERGLPQGDHRVCAECAARLDVEERSTSRRAPRRQALIAIIGVALVGGAAVAGYGLLRSKPNRDRFTFPGYEDLVIGAPVPKDIESSCRRENPPDPDRCDGTRHTPVDDVLIGRRPDLGVIEVIVGRVPEATMPLLTSRWGEPADRRSVGTNGSYVTTWCTSDHEEQAELAVTFDASGRFEYATAWTLMRDRLRAGMFDCHRMQATAR